MILVAGGTGTLGAHVVRLALAQGHAVRVLTRDPRRARALPAAVEVMTGDVREATNLAAAVNGCEAVVSAVHGFAGPGAVSPEAIDRDANRALVRAAASAGVARFVLVSVFGAAPDHPMSLHRAKYAAEQAVRASGVSFTIVRSTAFLETWLALIGGPLATKGEALVFGPGLNPINLVSARDVAALVVLSLGDKALRNQLVEIGGPENLAFVTLAQCLIEASGKPGRIKHVPLKVLRAMSVLARPFFPAFARQARAAVVMNTNDMTYDPSSRARFPSLPNTTLARLLEG